MKRLIWLVPALVLVLAACAGRPPGEAGPSARQQSNRITAEEVQMGPQANAYELVLALRPHWLRDRGPTSLGASGNVQVQLYVDGTRYGSVTALRQMSVASIGSMSYLSPIEASAQFGLDHGNGAILVSTRR